MDHDDDLLRELGQEMPFPVEWDTYREQLMARLERTESARRRRGFFLFAVGTVVGIAATLAVVLLLSSAAETPSSAPTVTEVVPDKNAPVKVASVEAAPAVRWVLSSRRAKGHIEDAVLDPAVETHAAVIKPFVQRVGNGEIHFEGFSKPGAGKPGFVVAKISE